MRYILVLALLCPFLSNCQPITIKGKIINEQMEPVPGATITLKRSVNGQPSSVITQLSSDPKGEFTLSDVRLTDTLIITAIGYETAIETLDFNSRGLVTIILKRRASVLEEVVVNTGYQTIPKERATGSFELINKNQLNRQAGPNILARLNGMAGSLLFDNNTNRPPLTIRGLSTINSSKAPLIVLDNFPYEGDINNINPNDVESITVLKDAAAASIWGTRAGNGVIVITTKKPRFNQRTQVEINTSTSASVLPDLFYFQPVPATSFIELEQFLYSKGYYNSQLNNTSRPVVSPVVEILVKKTSGQISADAANSQLNALKNHDVRNDFTNYIYQPSVMQQYAVNLRGGADRISWLFSTAYDKNRNELAATFNRFNLGIQNTLQLNKKLQFSLSAAYTQTNVGSGRPSYESFNSGLYPYTFLANEQGRPLPVTKSYRTSYIDTAGGGRLLDWKYYPLEDYKHSRTASVVRDLLLNIGLHYKINNMLAFDLKYQWQQQTTTKRTLQDLQSFAARDLVNRFSQVDYATGTVKYIVPKGDILDQGNAVMPTHAVRSQLSADKNWGHHNLVAILGAELRQIRTSANSYRLYGYNDNLLTYANVDFQGAYPVFINGTKTFIPNGLSLSDRINRFVSFYANSAYTFKNRYTVSASVRRDASNLFGVRTNNKWQPLWSAGAAWDISKEPWYKLKSCPHLKIRLTYGYSGNVDQSRAAITTISYTSFGAAYTNFPQADILQYANPDLKWEKVRTVNTALEFQTKNNALQGSIEYYTKEGIDLLGNAPIDYTTGVGNRLVRNVANMQAKGFDLNISSKNVDQSFKWSSAVLLSYNKGKITKYFSTGTRGFDYIGNGNSITALEGQPVYAIASFKWAGLDSLGNPQGIVNGTPTTVYTDITGKKTGITDLSFSGSALPTLFGSVQNIFSYKGISLMVAVQYKAGHYFRRTSIDYGRLFSLGMGHSDFDKRWQKPGDEYTTSVPALIYPNNSSRDVFYTNSEILVEKADHIRLQFLNISFGLPPALLKKLSFQTVQFYVNASNLGILWRSNKYGIDPDYGTTLPPPRSITIGIRANL